MSLVLALFLACAAPDSESGLRAVFIPGEGGPTTSPTVVMHGPSSDAMDEAVQRARERAPAGATIVVEPPFVVIGTEPQATVEARAEGTVRRVVDILHQDFVTAELDEPWEIWLFGDADTYERETLRLFGQPPGTPYGFADGNFRALVMNISTGGGTLVHELVHPYLNADLPGLPVWFNEGLASLYEQVGEEDGHLVGYPNWRLPRLQSALRDGQALDFATFMAQSDVAFRGERLGVNYAQARYICYWLQEQGLLRPFYRRLRANPAAGGYTAFREVLGEPDMASVQREWAEFVLSTPYP